MAIFTKFSIFSLVLQSQVNFEMIKYRSPFFCSIHTKFGDNMNFENIYESVFENLHLFLPRYCRAEPYNNSMAIFCKQGIRHMTSRMRHSMCCFKYLEFTDKPGKLTIKLLPLVLILFLCRISLFGTTKFFLVLLEPI